MRTPLGLAAVHAKAFDKPTAIGLQHRAAVRMIEKQLLGNWFTRSASVKTKAAYHEYLATNFPSAVDAARAAYPAKSEGDVSRQFDLLLGDALFNFGTRELLRHACVKQSKIYRYLFTRGRNGTAGEPAHGDELQYVFGTLAAEHKGNHRPFDDAHMRLSAEMQNAWVNFAKTGDPNGGDLPNWPFYDVESEPYLDFGAKIVVGHGGRAEQLNFLASYYGSRH